MSVAELPIQIDHQKIAEFCRVRGIRKLSLFGSVLREDFNPDRSDVDVLAEFEPGALKGVGFRYFGYGDELAAIIGRRVDFCSRLNKYIEAVVRRETVPIVPIRFRAKCGQTHYRLGAVLVSLNYSLWRTSRMASNRIGVVPICERA